MTDYQTYSDLFQGEWSIHKEEKPTWDLVKTFLNPGCVFFDIGCQKGIYSRGVIDLFGENCSVYGFDVLEHPEIIELENQNKNFKFTNSAVGDGKTLEDCIVHYDTNTKLTNQQTISLDQFCKINKIKKIDFIKIDVDGLQDKVIVGSVQVLKNMNPILVIEMNHNIGYDNQNAEMMEKLIDSSDNKSDKIVLKYLKKYNYKCITVKNGSNCFFIKE